MAARRKSMLTAQSSAVCLRPFLLSRAKFRILKGVFRPFLHGRGTPFCVVWGQRKFLTINLPLGQ